VAVLAGAAYVAGLALDLPALRLASKPVPAMALAVIALSRGAASYGRVLALGLVLSAVGDALLEAPDRFVPGLLAFLLAHVAYTVAFVRDAPRVHLARALPFALWLGAAFLWLRPGLGPLTGPVAVYMLAIGAMMWRAAARVGSQGLIRRGEWAGVAGALLFGISDTLIASDRFRAPVPGARYAIILLYWAGQAGIASSARAGGDQGLGAAALGGGGARRFRSAT
jgi:uncharacterized membrane protein YhhN